MRKKIDGNEIKIRKLFDQEHYFTIPEYQRPFSWGKDNFERLFDDIYQEIKYNLGEHGLDEIPSFNEDPSSFKQFIQKFEPYFLGSIILQTENLETSTEKSYDIVDGQQRLVSLSILLAVLRDCKASFHNELHTMIYQKAKAVDLVTKDRQRIKLNKYDKSYLINDRITLKEFYNDYILSENGTKKVLELNNWDYREPIQHMIEAVTIFWDKLDNLDNNKMVDLFGMYLLHKVVLVVVKTISESSAFRLFNVLNTRGMPLSNADILKSLNLRHIEQPKREKYARMWEHLEEEFGVDGLERIIGLIRTIKLKEKAQKTIHEEFTDKIFDKNPNLKGEKFVKELDDITSILFL